LPFAKDTKKWRKENWKKIGILKEKKRKKLKNIFTVNPIAYPPPRWIGLCCFGRHVCGYFETD